MALTGLGEAGGTRAHSQRRQRPHKKRQIRPVDNHIQIPRRALTTPEPACRAAHNDETGAVPQQLDREPRGPVANIGHDLTIGASAPTSTGNSQGRTHHRAPARHAATPTQATASPNRANVPRTASPTNIFSKTAASSTTPADRGNTPALMVATESRIVPIT